MHSVSVCLAVIEIEPMIDAKILSGGSLMVILSSKVTAGFHQRRHIPER
jgi:hypothetical protein